jgi:DNA-binding beta-propeller fold protein YncE
MKSKLVLYAVCCLLYAICTGQWLERSVTVGDTMGTLYGSSGVLFNPLSGNVYVGSAYRALIFNPTTLQKIPCVPYPGVPVLCPAAGKVYLMASTVSVIDAVADTFLRSFALASGLVSDQYSYSSHSNRMFAIVEPALPTVAVIDCSGDSLLDVFLPPACPTALAVDSATDRLFVGVRSAARELYVYDCAGDTLVASIQTGLGQVARFAFSPVSRRLYCYGSTDTIGPADKLLVVDADSLGVRGTIEGALQPRRTAFNSSLNRITTVSDGSVQVIDCAGDSVLHTRLLGSEAMDVTTSPLTGKTYVVVSNPDSVAVLDARDSLVNWIPMSETTGTSLLAYSVERNELYCARQQNLVTVVDAGADTVRGVMDYAYYTLRQALFNPAGNKLYLLCPGADMVLVMNPDYSFRRIPGAVTGNYGQPVLQPAMNRLYVADAAALRVIDCNSDSLVRTVALPGVSRPVPVLVPDLNRLYVFSGSGNGDYVYAYDCLRDTAVRVLTLTDAVPCAVFDPRSGRVFFACEDAPSVRVLDPVRDTVVRTFDLAGGSTKGRLAINSDLGRVYYTDQSPDSMYTIDVLSDSVVGSIPLPWDIDSLLLNRRLGKLYLCSRDSARVLVFDCASGTFVDTIAADFHYSALMNDRNDKLYLRYGAVVDCRYDSVVTMLEPGLANPRCMAWNMIDNRVYQSSGNMLYVYRDDPSGVEGERPTEVGQLLTVLGNPARGAVRLKLQIPSGEQASLLVYDAAGRLVHSSFGLRTSSFRLDLRSMPAGVYFICLEAGGSKATGKVIVQR